jgi:hypothetical protein
MWASGQMDDYYYVSDGGEPRGPYAKDQLRSMWSAGQISATTLFCAQGSEEWKSIEELALAGDRVANAPKTVKQAYLSWGGLGLFDLIPGIRGLPYFVRFALMVICILTLCLVLLPKIFQRDDSSSAILPALILGEPPSVQLAPCFAPILAPLKEGASLCDSETISRVLSSLRAGGIDAADIDKEIYSTAVDTALVLQEALEVRNRHLEKLAKSGDSDLAGNERQHLDLAVDVSWRRNVETYLNRSQKLFLRLLRLEKNRFRSESAPVPSVEL